MTLRETGKEDALGKEVTTRNFCKDLEGRGGKKMNLGKREFQEKKRPRAFL
jgi:hypothetical protein